MSVRVCRWGVLGTATIARKFWRSVALAGNAHLQAVASRDLQRARRFVEDAQSRFPVQPGPVVLDDYARLIVDPEVDAVYIPLPTGLRPEWVIAAAAAGKHVLSEKPCASSLEELGRMLDACRKAEVQFMDNVMFMHSGRLAELRNMLDDPLLFGGLRRISTQFSFAAPEEFFEGNIRLDPALERWGCLGDLGWYNIRIALWATGELPVEVVARFGRGMAGRSGSSTPPVEISGEMFFAGGRSAAFYCSFVAENQQWVHFSGSRGSLYLDDFALGWHGPRLGIRHNRPTFNSSGWDFNYVNREQTRWIDESSNGEGTAQEVRLVRHFSSLVLEGKTEDRWPEVAFQTQQVMGALLESAESGGRPVSVDGSRRWDGGSRGGSM